MLTGIMLFKNPEILYFLFLLIIPVIIHLFQLQRFEKVAFTNVKLLKEIKQQTRKSSRLKKLLLLLTRLLLLASLIIAFAQPYLNKKSALQPKETYIYLDNSFSMQAKGEKGELLQRAKDDLLIQLANKSNEVTIITNNHIYKNIEYKNDLLQIGYYPVKKDLKAVLLQIDNLRSNKIKKPAHIIVISDFQKNTSDIHKLQLDSLINYFFIQTVPVQKGNISMDSVWINDKNHENAKINAMIKSNDMAVDNLSVSLFINDTLFGKSTITLDKNKSKTVEFVIPYKDEYFGNITLEDNRLKFDNTLFFNTIKNEKIPVLVIGSDNIFLSKIYTEDEFVMTSANIKSIDYSLFSKQRLIILNELQSFSNVLIQSLKGFRGHLVIIPSKDIDLQTYNQLLATLLIGKVEKPMESKIYINKINYNHPFFKNVFEQKTDNFQYPMVKQYYPNHFFLRTSLLKRSDDHDFLTEINKNNQKIYWFSSSLDSEITNFINSSLVVPVFYNFSLQNISQKKLYYTIGEKNEIELKNDHNNDAVFHLQNEELDFIPLQSKSSDFVKIQTEEKPVKAGVYALTNNLEKHQNISFNYNRNESDLTYYQLDKNLRNKQNVQY
ncbi:MAG: BatA domain-containing protein, partial [Flavobacteriaceae bacterium]|nr:BatA domain-containing protein [Flavobacteriaceae bacterium]